MPATLLPEFAAESVELAERLTRLSAEENIAPAEAKYLRASGLAAMQRVHDLWPIVRERIGRGMMGHVARGLLCRLLDAVNRNLALAETLQKLEPDGQPRLNDSVQQLLTIKTEASRIVAMLDAPTSWPDEQLLEKARDEIRRGEYVTAEEIQRSLLDEASEDQ